MGWDRVGILRFLPSPTLVIRDHIAETLALLPKSASICDVGAGGRRILPDVTTVDGFAAPGVDVVSDIHRLALSDRVFDCVFCTGTLEHVRDPRQAVAEIHRIVRPGGIVHIDVPFIQGYHADPTDYWRFTLDGLKLLCEDFDELASGTHIGPTSGLVWIAREWANSWSSHRVISNVLLGTFAVLLAPLKYLDYLMIRGARSHRVASAVYFRGRRPATRDSAPAASR